MKTAVGSIVQLERKTTRDEELEQPRGALPKNLIRPLPYRIAKAGDLETCSPIRWCMPALGME
jgi:hypothetical protein